jgi:hypothetical protein
LLVVHLFDHVIGLHTQSENFLYLLRGQFPELVSPKCESRPVLDGNSFFLHVLKCLGDQSRGVHHWHAVVDDADSDLVFLCLLVKLFNLCEDVRATAEKMGLRAQFEAIAEHLLEADSKEIVRFENQNLSLSFTQAGSRT